MKSRYLKTLSDPGLARFQTLQAGNDCALHAISAALGLLCDLRLDPKELAAEINRLWWRGKFYRVLPGWAVAPPMQARIVNYLARSRALPISARLLHLSPEILRNLPDDCLLYTSDAADDRHCVDLGGPRILKKKNTK